MHCFTRSVQIFTVLQLFHVGFALAFLIPPTYSGKFCDKHVKMCARRRAEYEEELWGPKEEKEPQRQLLDSVFNLQPRMVLRTAVILAIFHSLRGTSSSNDHIITHLQVSPWCKPSLPKGQVCKT
ncbi:uncharacterized protein LOC133398273 isoform X3 [Phycodurus eques]|uniref:uncharacterized protein LOC133398273 isoform X3 n=1 Tax=Phycodurus eques TaxID=693459 RepID=UPI002ACE940D|nr:uncharacterized protein LOC133398273 isoform X3 [Phycodurus eques]